MKRRLLVTLSLVGLFGCQGPSSDPGFDAQLRVGGAQFYRGAPPQESGGPTVTGVAAVQSIVQLGRSTGVSGLVPRGTGAVIAYALGDVGHWVFLPGTTDSLLPDQLDFGASFSLTQRVAPGQVPISLLAVDLDGKVGPSATLMLTAQEAPLPSGHLVVSLDWDTEADLDLHVVDPSGTEIWAKKINSYQPPPPPALPGPDDYKNGGILDFDSNSQCVIDGRRIENVVWSMTPPSGHYVVRVDTFSMCGRPYANFRVRAQLDGASLGEALGETRDTDTRFAHGAGAGVLALSFDVP